MGKTLDFCVKCQKKPFLNSVNRLCEACFCEVVEKRVRRYVRGKDFFKKNSNVLLIDDGSAEAKVTVFLFNSIFKDFPLKLSIVQKSLQDIDSRDLASYDGIVIPWNLDMDAEEFLLSMFNDKCISSSNSKFIKLLSSISGEEIKLFAKLKNLDFIGGVVSSDVSEIINSLEKKYPGTKSSIIKSRERLY